MTTTMLSSNKSSSDKRLFDSRFSGLYKNTVRQNFMASILYTVCLMLVTVLPTYISARNMDTTFPTNINLLSESVFFAIVGYVVPILVSSVVFHYLHNRLSVDFYHSMPVSRAKLFLSKYFAGLTILLIPVVLAKILCTAIQLAFFTSALSAGQIILVNLADLFFWLVMYTAIYALSCLVAVTSSNTMESVIYSAALNGAPTVLAVIILAIPDLLYGVHSTSAATTFWFSPYGTISHYFSSYMYAAYVPVDFVFAAVVWLAVTVAAVFLCVRLYNRFHSEWAQMWGRQSALTQVMKTLAGILMMTMLAVTIFESIFDSNTVSFAVSALVGGPVGFLLVEGVTGKGFHNLGKNLRAIAVTVVLCLMIPLFLATGGFGMENSIPALNKIEQITFDPNRYGFSSTFYYAENPDGLASSAYISKGAPDIVLTEEKSKELVLQLHQNALEEKGFVGLKNSRTYFTYTLKPFGKMARSYSFAAKDIPVLVELMCQDEYIRQTEPAFSYTPEILGKVTLTDPIGNFSREISADRYQQLLEALRADLLEKSPETIYDYSADPVAGLINLEIDGTLLDESRYTYRDAANNFKPVAYHNAEHEVRSSHKNTLALLDEWNIPLNTDFDSVKSMTVMMPQYYDINLNFERGGDSRHYEKYYIDGNLSYAVTDTKDIADIIALSSCVRVSPSCNPVVVELADPQHGSRYLTLYIENSDLLSILEDSDVQIPYLLSAEELDYMFTPNIGNYDPSFVEGFEKGEIFDLEGRTSVAEFARQNNLNWLDNKTPAQLEAMEKTAFTSTDGQMLFYSGYLGFYPYY